MNGLWFLMLLIVQLTPVMIFIVGYTFTKFPPKTINLVYGYRTKESMKNMDTWLFAHAYIGKIWLIMGSILVVMSLIVMLLIDQQNIEMVSFVAIVMVLFQIFLMYLTVWMTENKLTIYIEKNENVD